MSVVDVYFEFPRMELLNVNIQTVCDYQFRGVEICIKGPVISLYDL